MLDTFCLKQNDFLTQKDDKIGPQRKISSEGKGMKINAGIKNFPFRLFLLGAK